MKLRTYFDEFIAITIVFFIIATFALAAHVQGQEQSESAAPLSEPVDEEAVPVIPIDPPLEAIERDGEVILNPEADVTDAEAAPEVLETVSEEGVVTRVDRVAYLRDSLGVVETKLGSKIVLEADILFDFDKAVVKESADETLDEVAEFIAMSGDREVEIVGYADAIGNEDYNLDLSWDRSKAVINHLVEEEDLPRSRFRAVGRGEEGAEAPNTDPDGTDNPEGRQENRRVEILIRKGIDASAEKPGPELN